MLNISFQAVSKWENGTTYPDIAILPKLAAALHITIDALLGYSNTVLADYDQRYKSEGYYWGLMPNRICYDIMKILPPIKPYRVLDIGCGEGKDAVFLPNAGMQQLHLIYLHRELKKRNGLLNIIKSKSSFLKLIFLITALMLNLILYSAAEYFIFFQK